MKPSIYLILCQKHGTQGIILELLQEIHLDFVSNATLHERLEIYLKIKSNMDN